MANTNSDDYGKPLAFIQRENYLLCNKNLAEDCKSQRKFWLGVQESSQKKLAATEIFWSANGPQ